jgi:hypothetical protein
MDKDVISMHSESSYSMRMSLACSHNPGTGVVSKGTNDSHTFHKARTQISDILATCTSKLKSPKQGTKCLGMVWVT